MYRSVFMCVCCSIEVHSMLLLLVCVCVWFFLGGGVVLPLGASLCNGQGSSLTRALLDHSYSLQSLVAFIK